MPKIEKSIISREKYLVKAITVRELAELAPNLPTAQQIRGRLWRADVSAGLVQDLKDGKYVPPLVLAGSADSHDMSDGQQRMGAVLDAFANGELSGDEELLLVVDAGRTFEESFRVLNLGVPVGAGLVAAMAYQDSTKSAVLNLANHELFDLYAWTGTQLNRTARADFASSALAICAGWQSPESSNAKTVKWLADNGEAIDSEAIDTATHALDALCEALKPYVTNASITPAMLKAIEGKVERDLRKEERREAKTILAEMRKKSMFMTAVACVSTGSVAEDVLAAFDRPDLLTEVTYTIPTAKGKPRKIVARWDKVKGAGSSGSNSEYVDRLHVLRHAASQVPVSPKMSAEVAAATMAADEETAAESLLAEVMGV